jgi:hypothetical protein
MIHHFSISARDPEHVASVLAEVIDGHVFHFRPFAGSFIAIAGDVHGTAIEVYPLGTELLPGGRNDPVHAVAQAQHANFTATHAAISVARDEASIQAIAAREDWRALTCDRGDFRVIEFWVENRVMIEFLTPEMAKEYLRAIDPQRWINQVGPQTA